MDSSHELASYSPQSKRPRTLSYESVVTKLQTCEREYKTIQTDIERCQITDKQVRTAEQEVDQQTQQLKLQEQLVIDMKIKLESLATKLHQLKQQQAQTDASLLRSHSAYLASTAYNEYNTLVWVCLVQDRVIPHLPPSITKDPYIHAIAQAKSSGDADAIKQAEEQLQRAIQPWKLHAAHGPAISCVAQQWENGLACPLSSANTNTAVSTSPSVTTHKAPSVDTPSFLTYHNLTPRGESHDPFLLSPFLPSQSDQTMSQPIACPPLHSSSILTATDADEKHDAEDMTDDKRINEVEKTVPTSLEMCTASDNSTSIPKHRMSTRRKTVTNDNATATTMSARTSSPPSHVSPTSLNHELSPIVLRLEQRHATTTAATSSPATTSTLKRKQPVNRTDGKPAGGAIQSFFGNYDSTSKSSVTTTTADDDVHIFTPTSSAALYEWKKCISTGKGTTPTAGNGHFAQQLSLDPSSPMHALSPISTSSDPSSPIILTRGMLDHIVPASLEAHNNSSFTQNTTQIAKETFPSESNLTTETTPSSLISEDEAEFGTLPQWLVDKLPAQGGVILSPACRRGFETFKKFKFDAKMRTLILDMHFYDECCSQSKKTEQKLKSVMKQLKDRIDSNTPPQLLADEEIKQATVTQNPCLAGMIGQRSAVLCSTVKRGCIIAVAAGAILLESEVKTLPKKQRDEVYVFATSFHPEYSPVRGDGILMTAFPTLGIGNEVWRVNDFRQNATTRKTTHELKKRAGDGDVNVLFFPVTFEGMLYLLLVSTKPIAQGQHALLDYGEKYWLRDEDGGYILSSQEQEDEDEAADEPD